MLIIVLYTKKSAQTNLKKLVLSNLEYCCIAEKICIDRVRKFKIEFLTTVAKITLT
jgi:hypothetical protein